MQGEFAEKRIGHVGNDQANRLAATTSQAACDRIRDVAKFANGKLDSLKRRRRHRRMSVDDARNAATETPARLATSTILTICRFRECIQ